MFFIVSCHYILGCDLLHSDKQLIQIRIFVDCFSDMTNTSLFLSAMRERNIHPGSWRSVGSAMFILLIVLVLLVLSSISGYFVKLFEVTCLCRECDTQTVMYYNALRGNERVRTHCQQCRGLGRPLFPPHPFRYHT